MGFVRKVPGKLETNKIYTTIDTLRVYEGHFTIGTKLKCLRCEDYQRDGGYDYQRDGSYDYQRYGSYYVFVDPTKEYTREISVSVERIGSLFGLVGN